MEDIIIENTMIRSKKIVAVVFALLLCLSNTIMAFAGEKSIWFDEASAQCRVIAQTDKINALASGGKLTGGTITVTANCAVLDPYGKTITTDITMSKSTSGSYYVDATFTTSELNTYIASGYKIQKINYAKTVKFDLPINGQVYTTTISYVSTK